jgi:hypothetical protein
LFPTAEGSPLLETSLSQSGEELINILQVLLDRFIILENIGSQFQIFMNREGPEDETRLRDIGDSHPNDIGCGKARDLLILKLDRSLRRMEGTSDGFEKSRFPCTVCADHRDQFSLVHFEGDIVNDGEAAVSDFDLRDL